MSYVFLSKTTPTARKNHRCRVCWQRIPKGEKHVAIRAIDDVPYTVRLHFACRYFTKDWDDSDWENNIPGEVTREECEEYYSSKVSNKEEYERS